MPGKTTGKALDTKASKANTLTITDDGKQSHVNLVRQAALSARVACGTKAKTFAKGGLVKSIRWRPSLMHEKVDRISGDPVHFHQRY
jgi:hypothetical protein